MSTARIPVVHEIVGVRRSPPAPRRAIAVEVADARAVEIEVKARARSVREVAQMWHEQWLEMLS